MQDRLRANVRWSVAGVFALSFLIVFLLMDLKLNAFDEGIVLVDAMRTLHGDVVHRDFYSSYGPGSYYILALLFRVDPHWFVMARIYGVATRAGIVAASFGLLVGRTRLVVTLAFTAMGCLWMVADPYYLYPLFPSVLLALIGSALLLQWMEGGRSPHLLLAGASAGATALFRYDAGFFLATAHVVAVSLAAFLVEDPTRRRFAVIGRAGTLYALGAAAVFLPFAVYYLSVAPVAAFAADIIDYPIHYYAAMRGLPFPRPRDLLSQPGQLGVYLPILAVLLAVFEFARIGRRTLRADTRSYLTFLVIFTPLTAIFYYKGVVRVSSVHMLMSIMPCLPLLAVVLDRWLQKERGPGRMLAALVATVALIPPLSAAKEWHGAWTDGRTPIGELSARRAASDGASCPPIPAMTLAWQEPDYRRAGDYIRRVSRRDEPILIALSRHDKIFANPVSLYFATQRYPGTHWHQFDPGLQTRADIQAGIVSDIRARGVRWVIRDASFADVNEPNQSSRSSGVHVLDRYLEDHYRPVAEMGKVQIWLLDGVAAPHIARPCLAAAA